MSTSAAIGQSAKSQFESGAKKVGTLKTGEAAETIAEQGPVSKEGSGTEKSEGVAPPLFQLAIDGDKVNGIFDIGYTTNSSNIVIDPDNKKVTAQSSTDRFALKINAPISQKKENGTFDLKGLGNGATAKLEYTRYNGKFALGGYKYFEVLNRSVERCLVANATNAQELSVLTNFRTEMAKNRISGPSTNNANGPSFILDAEIPRAFPALKQAAETLATTCIEDFGDEGAIIRQWGTGSEVDYFSAEVENQHPVYFYGVSALLGYENYDFLDRINFRVSDSGRFAYDGSIYGGVIGKKGNWSLRGTASYARGYQSPDNAELCRMVAASSDQECISGPDGTPIKKENAYLSGELRLLFPLGKDKTEGDGTIKKAPRFAIAPEVTYDVDQNEWAVDVPVYLHRDKKGILDGGVRFGYRSDMKDFAVGVFIGVPFGGIH